VRVPDQRWGITERIKAPSNEEVSEYGMIIKIELVLSMKNYTRANFPLSILLYFFLQNRERVAALRLPL